MRAAQQAVFKSRREYNRWVANQTLEDYALRFTARKSRKLKIGQVGMTALGATAFLALEALSGAATLQYGVVNTFWAIAAVSLAIILTGTPITYHAARNGLDIDLLTRGAGFGYLGSTITSLVYASFTFIFFAIEAAILASALRAVFDIPLEIGYILCVVMVIPVVTHGITAISRFQIGTQPVWLVLQIAALVAVIWFEYPRISQWMAYQPSVSDSDAIEGFDLAMFGACSALFFALVAQIGEQVDYLRFLPEKNRHNRKRWWFWMLLSGPGWISIGAVKMIFGSFLAYLAITSLTPFEQAVDPVFMYQMCFAYLTESPATALLLSGVLVIVSQLKINVTNAYAGSIAWSNFFSRLTHNHPGRVVWLIFNMVIALMLMELGFYRVLETIVSVFALTAISWLGCLSADLLIAKPLGLSPAKIEFKRSHLYDINPVGFVSMAVAVSIGVICFLGLLGDSAKHLAHYISLGVCYLLVPIMAYVTGGKYYLARVDEEPLLLTSELDQIACSVCENSFDAEDMSHCPAYGGHICSLCCSLDARCLDMCKPDARVSVQARQFLNRILPGQFGQLLDWRVVRFLLLFLVVASLNAALLSLIYLHNEPNYEAGRELLRSTIWTLFYFLTIVFGVLSWLILLAHESRKTAQKESNIQTDLLLEEIEAHKITDAQLQEAKEVAEQANSAKTRYLSGISHELRTPLQSILGYASLMQQKHDIPDGYQRMLKTINNSGEHLANLIEGLLEISKIEAGRLEIHYEVVDFNELLSGIEAIFAPQAANKRIEFRVRKSTPLPHRVKADAKRLKQILINLVSNAIKYTESGSVEFIINYRNEVAEFTINDTGVGIGEQDQRRILNPFERVRDARVPNVPGTGLGLTIVRLLVDILGGELIVKSELGVGSQFKVSLMLPWTDEPVALVNAEEIIIGYEGPRHIVAVVDDDAIHRGLVADILAPIYFDVIEAPSANALLEQLPDLQVSLFLLDINMPGMDGITLTAQLRKEGYTQPIILLSADALETRSHLSRIDLAKHDFYITKPVRNRLLIEYIGNALSLTWRYAPTRQALVESEQFASENYQLGDAPLLHEIARAASIGHKRGVVNLVSELEKQAGIPSAFIKKLNQYVDELRFEDIEKLIEGSAASE